MFVEFGLNFYLLNLFVQNCNTRWNSGCLIYHFAFHHHDHLLDGVTLSLWHSDVYHLTLLVQDGIIHCLTHLFLNSPAFLLKPITNLITQPKHPLLPCLGNISTEHILHKGALSFLHILASSYCLYPALLKYFKVWKGNINYLTVSVMVVQACFSTSIHSIVMISLHVSSSIVMHSSVISSEHLEGEDKK